MLNNIETLVCYRWTNLVKKKHETKQQFFLVQNILCTANFVINEKNVQKLLFVSFNGTDSVQNRNILPFF